MKNIFKMFGTQIRRICAIALAAVFGMTVVGCDNGSTDDQLTVTFDLDGGNINGSTAPVEIKFHPGTNAINNSYTFPSPKKDGYIGSGWYTEKNGGGTEFTTSTPVTSDLTVYINWKVESAFTVNNIPAEYNGKYALIYGSGTNGAGRSINIFGGNVTGGTFNIKTDLTIEGSGFKAIKISNGSVSVPTWEPASNHGGSSSYPVRYTGYSGDTLNITFYIYDTETPSGFSACVKSVTFSSVAYSTAVVAKSWNDAH